MASITHALAKTGANRRKTILDRFMVNGMPIGDVTPRKARAWAAAALTMQARCSARFVELLTAGMSTNRPIRAITNAALAEAAWQRAQREVSGALVEQNVLLSGDESPAYRAGDRFYRGPLRRPHRVDQIPPSV